MLCLTEAAQYVSLAKDVITAAAAATAAVVGVRGLRAWKRQLAGNSSHELARRLLVSTFNVRESIRHVRVAWMSEAEMLQALKAEGVENPTTEHLRLEEAGFSARWRILLQAKAEFDAQVLEAEALWGTSIEKTALPLRTCIVDLDLALRQWLGRRQNMNFEEIDVQVMAIVFNTRLNPKAHEFSARVDDAVKRLEDVIRPHLITTEGKTP